MSASSFPNHHFGEGRLLEYVAGTCSETESLLIAAHLTLCPNCREQCEHIENVAAALLAEDEQDGLAGGFEALLVDNAADVPESHGSERFDDLPSDLQGVPQPVLRDLLDRRWRFYGPGVQHMQMRSQWNGIPARLFKLAAGSTVPQHSHRATELLLVFSGGFDDPSGTYVRGDVQICGPEVEHALSIHAEAPCIALAGYEQRLIPRTLRGRLFALFRGI